MRAKPRSAPYHKGGSDSRADELDLRPSDDPRLEVGLGLLTPYHRDQLGEAMHFYLCLLAQRRPHNSPWVGGHDPGTRRPLVHPIDLLAAVHAVTTRTIQRWLRICRRGGYIRTEAVFTGSAKTSGLRIRILKSKWWRRGQMVVVSDPPSGGVGHARPTGSGHMCPTPAAQTELHLPVMSVLPQEDKILPRNTEESKCAVSEATQRSRRSQGDPKNQPGDP